MEKIRIRDYVLSTVFLGSIVLLLSTPREDFFTLFSVYSIAFLLYYIIVTSFTDKRYMMNSLIIGSMFISLVFTPQLSNDYFRFLWDGELQELGLNPLSHRPADLIQRYPFQGNSYFNSLYEGMGSLSANNYSCYPTVKQVIFRLATLFSDTLWINLLVLKLVNILLLLPIYYYLGKLLQRFHLPAQRIYWLLLNPLFFLEVIANLHFEGIMLSFLVAGVYYLLQKKYITSALLFAAAVNVKLTPLIMLPFLWRFLGPKLASWYYLLSILFSFLMAIIYITPTNYLFFIESLSLYFKAFEFNSSVFYYYIQYGRWTDGWNKIRYFGPRLARYTMMILAVLSLYGTYTDWQTLFRRIVLGYFAYLLLSSTIHPWYLVIPLGLSLFTSFSFMIIWSYLILLTYYYYSSSGTHDPLLRSMIAFEYLVVIGVMLYELIKKKALIRSFSMQI